MNFTEPNFLNRKMFDVWGERLGVTEDESDFAMAQAWKALVAGHLDRWSMEKVASEHTFDVFHYAGHGGVIDTTPDRKNTGRSILHHRQNRRGIQGDQDHLDPIHHHHRRLRRNDLLLGHGIARRHLPI